jgi:hypothetical protein
MMQREPAIDHDEGTRKGLNDSFHGKGVCAFVRHDVGSNAGFRNTVSAADQDQNVLVSTFLWRIWSIYVS